MYYDDDLERYVLDLPRECPKCSYPLELDHDYGEEPDTFTTKLVCTNPDCDYELDATEEFRMVDEANDELYDEDEDDDTYNTDL